MSTLRALLVVPPLERVGIHQARSILDKVYLDVPTGTSPTLSNIVLMCGIKHYEYCLVSCPLILAKLLQATGRKSEGSVQQWAGACIVHAKIKFLIIRSLLQLRVDTGPSILRRHVYKHLSNVKYKLPPLDWKIARGESLEAQEAIEWLSNSMLIAVDIETVRQPLSPLRFIYAPDAKYCGVSQWGIGAWMQIGEGKSSKKEGYACPKMTMSGYYGIRKVNGKLEGKAFVVPMDTMEDLYLIRKLNSLPVAKTTQNGNYENSYFARFNAPMYNWKYDTFHMMHCWMCEWPRTLDFLASVMLPNYEYWKDEIQSNAFEYNAKDVYTTAWITLMIMIEAPEWVLTNYLIEYPKNFVNHSMSLEGIKVDEEERTRIHVEYEARVEDAKAKLARMTWPTFNPASPKQSLLLMHALSRKEWKSSDEKHLRKWGDDFSLAGRIADCITECRTLNKAISNSLTVNLFCGRLLYELNAGGTDTGRAASKASNFWVGTQIQNQDAELRSFYVADDGYILGSCDNSQSESRTTAYISEDQNLIHVVETAKDFHNTNAALFFGMQPEDITKPLRNIGKRINHGSNYNMAEWMLIETMGRKAVWEANRLLKLNFKSIFRVASHLLELFIKTYPDIKGKYYDEVITEIEQTSKLVGASGWTRYCLGKPTKNKEDKLALNKYVAHGPQSLSVMMIDRALYKFWLQKQIRENVVRVKAQIHDEVLFQTKEQDPRRDEHMQYLSECLREPLVVKGRTLIIPNDGGTWGYRWSEL